MEIILTILREQNYLLELVASDGAWLGHAGRREWRRAERVSWSCLVVAVTPTPPPWCSLPSSPHHPHGSPLPPPMTWPLNSTVGSDQNPMTVHHRSLAVTHSFLSAHHGTVHWRGAQVSLPLQHHTWWLQRQHQEGLLLGRDCQSPWNGL